MAKQFKLLFAPAILTAGLVINAATSLAQQVSPVPGQPPGIGQSMMSGPMMLACGVFALLALTLIVLGIVALLKYLRTS